MLTRDDVTIDVYAEPDDAPVPDFGVELPEDVWAWAYVTVVVTDKVSGLRAKAHLGGCSYAGEDDFRRDVYFDSMVDEALAELSAKIEQVLSVYGTRIEGVILRYGEK